MMNTIEQEVFVIIPAYNEEAMLENTINQLKAAMATVSLNGEIIVTDNNSTDRTAEPTRKLRAATAIRSELT